MGDLANLLNQMLGGAYPPKGADGSPAQQGQDLFAALLSGQAGKRPKSGLGSIAGFGQQPKATDAFITDRLPFLQKAKRVVLPIFFIFCFWRGWIERWGLVQGALLSRSYFDTL